MPIPFSLIPEEIQLYVLQMTSLKDFANFNKVSSHSSYIASKVKSRLVITAEKITIDTTNGLVAIKRSAEENECQFSTKFVVHFPFKLKAGALHILGSLSDELCQTLKGFLILTSTELHITETLKCSPETFNDLLISFNITKFVCTGEECLAAEFFRGPAIQKIDFLSVKCSAISDDELDFLNATSMEFEDSKISSVGMNRLLNKWYNREREISNLSLDMNFDKYVVFDGVSYDPVDSYGFEFYNVHQLYKEDLSMTIYVFPKTVSKANVSIELFSLLALFRSIGFYNDDL